MKCGLTVLGTLLVCIISPMIFAGEAVENLDLSRYRWKNRILLVFSPSEKFPAFMQFLSEVTEMAKGLGERDVIVFRVVGAGQSRAGDKVLTANEAESLRKLLEIERDAFRVVLMGKDGMVKLSESAIKLTEIFAVIDSMPMRRQEMRQQGQGAE